MHCLGFGEHAKKSAHCPFHDDRRESFSVWQNDSGLWSFKCHAGCCDGGDEISFLELAERLSQRDAITRFLVMAGANGSKALTCRSYETLTFDWRACMDAFTDDEL